MLLLGLLNLATAADKDRQVDELQRHIACTVRWQVAAEQTLHTVAGERSKQLVRAGSGTQVLVHPQPGTILDVAAHELFSLKPAQLRRLWHGARRRPGSWVLQACHDGHEEDEGAGWQEVRRVEELKDQPLIAVNPAYVDYSSSLGLTLRPDGGGNSWGTLAHTFADRSLPTTPKAFVMKQESYAEHVRAVLQAAKVPWCKLTYLAAQLEHRYHLQPGTLATLTLYALITHDLGKLGLAWQRQAHA